MKTAINLMKEYGLDNIKAEIKNSPVHALVARIGALEDKSHLIGGRDQDDQKLRAMAMVLEEVRESIQCLADTGRFKGELPEDLPQPDSYQNLFSWLIALKEAIQTRVPNSGMFNGGRHSTYDAWQDHLKTYHTDLPTLLNALAGSSQNSDFSRNTFMNPCYFDGWLDAGCMAMDVLFTSNEEAVVDSLLEKLDGLNVLYPQPSIAEPAVAALKHCLLSKTATARLVAGGFNAKALASLTRHYGYPRTGGRDESTLGIVIVDENLSRIKQAIELAEVQAEQEAKEALQVKDRSAAFEARKATARRKVELQKKLADDEITPEELQELETL